MSAWANNRHLTLRDLTIRNGRALNENGGAIDIEGGNDSSLTIERVEFVNNTATYEGGAIRTQNSTRVEDSAFIGNKSGTFGGAISAKAEPLTVRNSSFSGNEGVSGIIFVMGDINPDINARLVNVTLTNNLTQSCTIESNWGARLSMSNSLVASNTPVNSAAGNLCHFNGGQIIASASHNNILGVGNNPGLVHGVNGNQIGVSNPLVGPLGHYGGATRTLPLLPGSPALNAGTSTGGDIPSVDQRGINRVGTPDIGAFESRGFTLAQISGTLQSADVGASFADPLVTEVTANQADEPVAGGQVRFAAPSTGASANLTTPNAAIGTDGRAQTTATANATEGGPYTVTAALPGLPTLGFSLTNTAAACAAFSFPYTLLGADNTARVAELRQAIECANANATDDVIDLGGFTLLFNTADADTADTALPEISSVITLRNGALQRDASATDFRLLVVAVAGHLIGESVDFRNGRASQGAAIYNAGTLELETSGFYDNGDIALTSHGGAIHSVGSTLRIVESRFERNAAELGGGVFHDVGDLWLSGSHLENNQAVDGGALFSLWYQARIYNSQFVANHAQRGGAIMTLGLQISRSRFERNTAATRGGAIFTEDADGGVHLSNSVFIGNEATDEAALIYADGWVALRNVTISGHVNGTGSNLFAATSGTTFTMANSIVWGNDDALADPSTAITINHSLIEDGYAGGTAILDIDPRFVDAANGDLRLTSGSPAIDAGSNAEVHQDFWMDIDDDGNISEELDDMDGNVRRYDDANVIDTGAGTAPIVDMGAYERQIDSMSAGITVHPTSGLVTTEAGGTASFTVVLDTQPTADVVIGMSSSETTEGTVLPTSLTFTAANWNIPQTVTVTGVDDAIVDGDITYTVVTAAATSADANYDGINPSDVAVTNLNVDLAPGGNAPALIPATGTPALWALFLFMLTAGTVLLRRR